MTADEMRARGYELCRQADTARAARDGALAALLDKDGAAMIRMARSQELVDAGTHYWHPLTGRLRRTS